MVAECELAEINGLIAKREHIKKFCMVGGKLINRQHKPLTQAEKATLYWIAQRLEELNVTQETPADEPDTDGS